MTIFGEWSFKEMINVKRGPSNLVSLLKEEIKRHLLLGRETMTNWDSILKSRDTILLTKVCIVKAMDFPVVMYGCESWTIKKAES